MSGWNAAVTALLTTLAVAGCTSSPGPADERRDRAAQQASPTVSREPRPSSTAPPAPRPSEATERRASQAARPDSGPAPASDGRPRRSSLTIPAISVRDLTVVPYRGSPDDAAGTRIQDGGVAASPHGPSGGVGPGGIGNYIVTAHRTSSTRAFAELPRLARGDRVQVDVGRTRYTYQIVGTRTTSFRSSRSLARQSAAVPGHPGRSATRAMITLSTCATPEDHARGNYWSDEFGNPEHRIDKIGVLVRARKTDRPVT
jgi:sortase A